MIDPIVSVIIPTYKRNWKYLCRAVGSVQNQTFKDLEIIVVDDSPESFKFRKDIITRMNDLCKVDQRIVYLINEKNLGGSCARNRGIELAKGKYITFLDDDDEYLPEKIEKQLMFMEQNKCDMSFSNMIMYNMEGQVVDYRDYKDIWSFETNELLKYHLMKHLTGTPTYMFVTKKLIKIGMFDDVPIMQEFFLMLKCISNGLIIKYLDSCDVKVYKHSGEGITKGKRKIDAEKRLYRIKQDYFSKLTGKQIRYIKFRHWAVMVVAYKRNKQYYLMPLAGISAFIVSPEDFFREIIKFVRKIRKDYI